MRFINHIMAIRGLITTGFSILVGHHRTRYMQTPDGAYDTILYMLSMGGEIQAHCLTIHVLPHYLFQKHCIL